MMASYSANIFLNILVWVSCISQQKSWIKRLKPTIGLFCNWCSHLIFSIALGCNCLAAGFAQLPGRALRQSLVCWAQLAWLCRHKKAHLHGSKTEATCSQHTEFSKGVQYQETQIKLQVYRKSSVQITAIWLHRRPPSRTTSRLLGCAFKGCTITKCLCWLYKWKLINQKGKETVNTHHWLEKETACL